MFRETQVLRTGSDSLKTIKYTQKHVFNHLYTVTTSTLVYVRDSLTSTSTQKHLFEI